MAEPLFTVVEASFPAEVISAAQVSERFWLANTRADIYASVTLAQWAVESNWGKSLSGKNNPFGIKATPAQIARGDCTYCPTKEFVNGRYVSRRLAFANFDSVEDAFEEHGRLLATSKYYDKARHADSPEQFARDLTGIYATSPVYGDTLISIMRQHDLHRYDTRPFTGPSLPATNPPIAQEHKDSRAGAVIVGTGAAGAVIAAGSAAAGEHVASWLPPLLAGLAIALIIGVSFVFSVVRKG